MRHQENPEACATYTLTGIILLKLDLDRPSYDVYWYTASSSTQPAFFNHFRALLTSISTSFISFVVLANAGIISITAL